jgi:hypothetical protein
MGLKVEFDMPLPWKIEPLKKAKPQPLLVLSTLESSKKEDL